MFEVFFQQGVEIQPKKNQGRVRDEEKGKENEKSNLESQKKYLGFASDGGIGGGWSLLVPQTSEPVMGGKEGLEVAGSFGERERERERERDFKRESDCGSDKYRGVRKRANVKCFTKILSVKYFT